MTDSAGAAASRFDKAAAAWDDDPNRARLMRAIGEAIVREARLAAATRVLDYGCGTGLVGLCLVPRVAGVTGADSSPGMLEVLRGKIAASGLGDRMQAVRLDLERDAVPPERYDLVVVGMAMHHIAAVDRVLRAFHELLRPGGAVCIADLDTEPGTFHGPEASEGVHHHGFDRAELKGRLEQAGFSDARDATVARFRKPVEGGGEQEFSIFLIVADRP